jgi:hypothetical protein
MNRIGQRADNAPTWLQEGRWRALPWLFAVGSQAR